MRSSGRIIPWGHGATGPRGLMGSRATGPARTAGQRDKGPRSEGSSEAMKLSTAAV